MKRDITQEAILYKSFVQIECTCIEYHHVINAWHACRTLQYFISYRYELIFILIKNNTYIVDFWKEGFELEENNENISQ